MVNKLGLLGKSPSTVVRTEAFINGTYVPAQSGNTFDTYNPATGALLAKVSSCSEEDVNAAVACARQAFQNGCWSELPPSDRKDVLLKFAALIEEHTLELAVLDAAEAGKPIADCLEGDIPETVACIRYHAEAVDKIYDQISPSAATTLALVVREAIGVVGLIVPWNFPLLMAAYVSCVPSRMASVVMFCAFLFLGV